MIHQAPPLSIIVCMNSDNPFMDSAFDSLSAACKDLPVEKILVTNGGYIPSKNIADNFDKVIHTVLGGLGYARNRGAELASAEFITFFDSDDILERSYVQRLLSEISVGMLRKETYAYSGTKNIDSAGNPLLASLAARLSKKPNSALWYKHPFTGATLVIPRDKFILIGGYKWGGYAEDYELSIRLRSNFGKPTLFQDNFYIYRLHGNAMSSGTKNKILGVLAIQSYAFISGKGTLYAAGMVVSTMRLLLCKLRLG